MALQATFTANFQAFDAAIKAATQNVKTFELSTKGVQKQLQTMVSSFDGSKIVKEASLTVSAIEKVGGVSKLTEGEIKKVQSTLDEAIAKFHKLGQEVPKDIQAVSDQIKALNQHGKPEQAIAGLLGISTSAAPAAIAVAGVTAAVGAAVVVLAGLGAAAVATFNQIVSLATGAANLGDQLFTTANKTGLSTEALSKLQFVAQQTDAPFETIINSIQKLGENLANNSGKTTAALSAIGVSIEDIRKSSPEEAFETIITALGKVPDAGQRAAAGAAIFGKQFKDIAQLTKEDMVALGEQAEELGIVFGDDFAVAGDRFNDAMGSVSKQLEGLKATIGAEFLPVFTAVIETLQNEFTAALKDTGLSSEEFGRIIDAVAVAVVQSLLSIISAAADVAAGLAQFFAGDTIKSASFIHDLKAISELILVIARGMSLIGKVPAFAVDSLEKTVKQLRELGSAELETGVNNTANRIKEFADRVRETADRVGEKLPDAIKKVREEIAAQGDAMRQGRTDLDGFGKAFGETGEKAEKAAQKIKEEMDKASRGFDLFAAKLGASSRGQAFEELANNAKKNLSVFNAEIERTIKELERAGKDIDAALGIGLKDSRPEIEAKKWADRFKKDIDAAMGDGLKDSGKKAAKSFGESFQEFLSQDLGDLIVGAFQGGGDVGKTIGAGIGNQLGQGIGQTLSTAIGGTLGSIVGGFAGPLGALAGGALGGLVDKLFGPSEHAKVNDMRDEFVGLFGDINKLNEAAQDAGKTLDAFLKADTVKEYERAVKDLEDAFQMQEAKEALIEQAGSLEALSARAQRLGIDLKSITDATSLEAFTEAVNALNAAYEAQQSRIEGLGEASQGLAASSSGLLAQITKQLEAGGGATADFLAGIQDKFANLGVSATTTFTSILAETGSWRKALDAVGPTLDDLIEIQEKLGLQGDETLRKLLEFRKLSQVHADIARQIEGAAQQLTGLGRAGRLTQDAIDRFSRDAVQNFDTLISRGVSVDQALMMMQPTLQALWEAQETLGLKTDDATASLIELARQNGLVGPGFVQEGDKMVAAIEKLSGVIQTLVDFLSGDVPEAAQTAASGVQDAFENLDIQVPVGFDVAPIPEINVPTVSVPVSVEGFARGTQGLRNFGRGTLVQLHGKEEVLTERQSKAIRSGRGSVNVTINAQGAFIGDYSSQQRLAEEVQKALAKELGNRRRMPLPGVTT